ncbi:MAG: MFS transporter [Planctomycetota bacterium]
MKSWPASDSMVRIAILAFAGEAIFVLPFVMVRLFRPTLLRFWDLSNTQVNTAMSFYGIVAVACYLFGGPLADRFRPRWLMATALLLTAILGIGMTRQPSADLLGIIYAGFGLTTILLFWSAMLRATHELGGMDRRGIAFGFLDGGRGLLAAILATLLVMLLDADSVDSVGLIIWTCVGTTAAAGLAIIFTFRNSPVSKPRESPKLQFQLGLVWEVLSRPAVWIQGGLLICAYMGYKSIDYVGLFGQQVYSLDEESAARLSTLAFWLRPPAALIAGWASDRTHPFAILIGAFAAMTLGCGTLASASTLGDQPGMLGTQAGISLMLLLGVITTAASVYAMRGIYFAVFDRIEIPAPAIGTAAGVVSMVGFLPDVFFGPITGWWIDAHGDAFGFRWFFIAMAGVATLGAGLCGLQWFFCSRSSVSA